MTTDPYIKSVSANSVAPAAAAVLADTGALAAGIYDVDIMMAVADTLAVGKGIVIEHRDAPNTGFVNAGLAGCPAGNGSQFNAKGIVVQLNERIRASVMAQAPAALSQYVVSISVRKVK